MRSDPVYRSAAAKAAVYADYDAALSEWQVSYESRFVDTTFGRTHVVVSGPTGAPPVILLHGGGGSAIDWRFNVAGIAAAYRVYMPDIVGEPGKSEGARPPYASGGHMAWFEMVRAQLGLASFRLAGTSLGSWIAWMYAIDHPERVSRVAIISPPNLAMMRPGFLLKAIGTAVLPTDGMIRRFQRAIFSPATPLPEDAMRAAVTRWRAQRGNPPPIPPATNEEIKSLPEHARVLVGADEPLYNVRTALERFRLMGQSEKLKVIPAAGHALTYEQALLLNQELIRLFGSDSGPA